MGFGSYDESEQGNHEIETEEIDETEQGMAPKHEGEISFEYGDASSEDLLEAYEQFQNQ